ncbi:hypothetical protein FOYG_02113 [Fusarium oxysporum NRRL 32931]|uniref:ABC transporter domain-containing protein n=1 Tax=Fusarium oxysporum NRRL 32931 TaxID=660029 RepID=W9J6T5_FUSOX|nr:hypothetical protein FOYG_02113 [Fusarium oxysporum NRRL 32931]
MTVQRLTLWRQTNTLANKNFTLICSRHITTTIYSAFLLPIILTVYLGIFQNIGNHTSEFGDPEPRVIRSLKEGLDAADNARDTVVFVDNGFTSGDIERVIKSLSDEVNDAGKTVSWKSNPDDMPSVCRSSFMGSTNCYGAVVFHSSPNEGDDGIWNYTLRGDFSLAGGFKYKDDNNDAQVYTLPLQLAVDSAIASLNSTKDTLDLRNSEEWPFTGETDKERKDRARRDYQDSIINYMGVGFILAFIGVSFHLPGNMSGEREQGLSQLIDAMMHTTRDYEAQMARMLSFFYAFAAAYAPGWIIASIITRFMIWKETSVIVIIVFFVLSGLALTSQAIMGGSLFQKAQLSGQVNSIANLLLGVLAQAIPNPGTVGVTILGLLFTPCSIIFFVISIAKHEAEGRPLNLLKAPPDSDSQLPPVILWIFMIIQLIVYPVIATFLERVLHGVTAESRTVFKGGPSQPPPRDAVTITGLAKVYEPSSIRRLFSFIIKPRAPTVAVNNLSFSFKHGQIVALLGANGSGKSTTLDAIAGMSRFNHGNITIDASRGIGIVPQQNVLWDELTVAEHIRLFNRLKSPFAKASEAELYQLIEAIGLAQKMKSRSGTLSGGQKRKLQLGMMLTGGSGVCCVDEVSSGIDPLSRRKIWDILLSERGRRTIIMTTHFLDEADLLSDDIAILSKGSLRAQGSPAILKDTLGSGYCIQVLKAKNVRNPPDVQGVSRTLTSTNIVYTAPSSTLAAEAIRALEASGIEYRLSTPTIEDVFLHLADEINPAQGLPTANSAGLDKTKSGDHTLLSTPDNSHPLPGKQTGFLKQVIVLIQKRYTLLKSDWIPHLIAFLIPIIAAAVMQPLIRNESAIGCSPQGQASGENDDAYNWLFSDGIFVAGPSGDIDSSLGDLLKPVLPGSYHNSSIELQGSFSSFRSYIEDNRKNVRPGGWWLGGDGESPIIAYRSENKSSVMTGVATLNLLNRMRTNITVATSYIPFDVPIARGLPSALQLAIFFTIASTLAPAFFGLYPNVERRNQVRALQYSSGVRSYSLWTAHLTFDFGIFVLPFVAAAIVFAVSSDMWFSVGYLFPVFALYAMTTILVSYVSSLFTRSQLLTYVAAMVYNSIGFAIYLISFMFILQRSSPGSVAQNITIAHYVVALFFPAGSLFRALAVGLNINSLACDGDVFYSYPAAMDAYGSPIFYLVLQAFILFSILLYNDSGNKIPSFLPSNKKLTPNKNMQPEPDDQEMAYELTNVDADNSKDGLSVQNLTKSFRKFTAVDNITFRVPHGQVFALLGPNGAGKSTTISVIRGDIQPSANGGDVFIEKTSVKDQRALARSHLGVCPQFDAIEPMTVLEHLRIYTRLRGVSDVEHHVQAITRAVGLEAFVNTLAPHLSGGNKRKLSLGIALVGNPSVILLDEPSSGLDAAAKRTMWRTLESLSPGRSILLTTHSMEEADALASQAGILARHMLAVGDVDTLRRRFDDSLYVHLVSRSAPHSTPEEMQNMRARALHLFPGAQVQSETYSGQMRLSVPLKAALQQASSPNGHDPSNRTSAIGQLILMLEENKHALGIKHHSVSPTTLNDVFLAIVGQHSVQEEGYGRNSGEVGPSKWRKFMLGPFA